MTLEDKLRRFYSSCICWLITQLFKLLKFQIYWKEIAGITRERAARIVIEYGMVQLNHFHKIPFDKELYARNCLDMARKAGYGDTFNLVEPY